MKSEKEVEEKLKEISQKVLDCKAQGKNYRANIYYDFRIALLWVLEKEEDV